MSFMRKYSPREKAEQAVHVALATYSSRVIRQTLNAHRKYLSREFLNMVFSTKTNLCNSTSNYSLDEIVSLISFCGSIDITGLRKDHYPFWTALEYTAAHNEDTLSAFCDVSPVYKAIVDYAYRMYQLDTMPVPRFTPRDWFRQPAEILSRRKQIDEFIAKNISDIRYVDDSTLTLFRLACL